MTDPLTTPDFEVTEPVEPTVTLYSGPDYTGESCTLPVDGRTYSLAATGLTAITSLKINWAEDSHFTSTPYLRVYTKRPTLRRGDVSDGTHTDFTKDAANTGTWATATYVKAAFVSVLAGIASARPGVDAVREPERTIYDTLP